MEKEAEEMLKQALETEEPPAEGQAPQNEEETTQEDGASEEVQEATFAPQQEWNTNVAKDEVSYWRHKYEVLQGKYNSEVPSLNNQVKLLTSQVDKLSKQLEVLLQSKNVSQVEEGSSTSDVEEDADDKLREFKEVYPDIYEAVEALYKKKIRDLEAKIKETEKISSQVAQKDFYATLDTLVPDWRTINTSQDFYNWTQEVDPFAGVRKYDLLMSAYNALDAKRVASFFEAYKKEKGISGKKVQNFTTIEPTTRGGTKTQPRNQFSSDIIMELNKQIREALSRKDYKKADELERKIDELLSQIT